MKHEGFNPQYMDEITTKNEGCTWVPRVLTVETWKLGTAIFRYEKLGSSEVCRCVDNTLHWQRLLVQNGIMLHGTTIQDGVCLSVLDENDEI